MCMKGVRNILRPMVMLASLLSIALCFVACKNETDTTLNQQQKSIENYLRSSHNPRLVEESEVGDSMSENPPFYTRWDMDIYRYIATYYDLDRDKWPEIVNGTTFDMTYSAYIFKSSAPTFTDLFATNDAENLQKLQDAGLNTSYEWSSEPMRITLGKGELLSSLETALEGCREGDEVEIYLTYPEAYGNKYIGKVPSKSSQMWVIKIDKVIK